MEHRAVIFEDNSDNLQVLADMLEQKGFEVLPIDHCRIHELNEQIRHFSPSLAIVDSKFENEIDGSDIVLYLYKYFPKIPVVICSVLLDDPNKEKWICRHYERIPNVHAIFGKNPFPPNVNDILKAVALS